jgi:3D (Asp-Asp-Asp) domain-containing protein
MKRETADWLIDICFTAATIMFIISALAAVMAFSTRAEAVEPEPVVIVEETVPEKEYLGVFETTAYCGCTKCCGKWADGYTYTGGLATQNRTIAVDPKVIPLGSVVEIAGQRYVAEDVGASIKQNRIDVFFAQHTTALDFGVQQHAVYLVREGAKE